MQIDIVLQGKIMRSKELDSFWKNLNKIPEI